VLNKIFGLAKMRETDGLLETGYTNLKLGIFTRLVKKYRPLYGEQQANLLAVAVIHEALIVEPANTAGENYRANNRALIFDEAMRLNSDREIAEAFSYLYAARSFHLVRATGSVVSDQSVALVNRATELSLYIPSTYDLCGSDDFGTCIHAISEYASLFVESAPKP